MLRVLCVDDEQRVLDGLESHLGFDHEIYLARGADEAWELMDLEGPFDAVVSDMRMPGCDGAELLGAIRRHAPDTVRILLTGFCDAQAAIRAVNEGGVHRYLTKPCSPDVLQRVIADGVEIVRLRRAERQLLDETVQGVVELLVDVLDIASPATQGRAQRARSIARDLAEVGGLEADERWCLEVAALLSGLGRLAVPDALLKKSAAGQRLSDRERNVLERVPSIGERLLSKIPRFEEVAKLVGAIVPGQRPRHPPGDGRGHQGMVELLRAVLWIESAQVAGVDSATIQERIVAWLGPEWAQCVPAPARSAGRIVQVSSSDVTMGMVLRTDLMTSTGLRLVAKGTEVTDALAMRIRTFAENVGLSEPIEVWLPK